jgi:hypothetical protein
MQWDGVCDDGYGDGYGVCAAVSVFSMKYYDLSKWEAEQRAANPTAPEDELKGLTDEERVRVQRKKASADASRAAETARLIAMKQALLQTREADAAQYAAIRKRHEDEALSKPTFESIAKKRKEKEEERIAAYRK